MSLECGHIAHMGAATVKDLYKRIMWDLLRVLCFVAVVLAFAKAIEVSQ